MVLFGHVTVGQAGCGLFLYLLSALLLVAPLLDGSRVVVQLAGVGQHETDPNYVLRLGHTPRIVDDSGVRLYPQVAAVALHQPIVSRHRLAFVHQQLVRLGQPIRVVHVHELIQTLAYHVRLIVAQQALGTVFMVAISVGVLVHNSYNRPH